MTEFNLKIKHRILVTTLFLGGLEGILLLLIMLNSHSAEGNAVFAGLSAPRVTLAALLLVWSIASIGVALAIGLVSSWGKSLCIRLDRLAACPEKLLTISFLLLSITLATPVLAGLLLTVSAGKIFERIAPAVGWASLVSLQTLSGLVLVYRTEYRKPEFLRNAPRKIIRVLFLEKGDLWAVAGLVVIATGTLYTASSISTGQVIEHDSGIFFYFGQQILKGDLPYRDLWDHKPPLIFYIDALGLLVGNRSMWGVWALELLSIGLGGALGYSILRQRFPRWVAFLATGLTVAHISFFLEGGNMTEEFALPLQFAALYLAFIPENRAKANWQAAITGALFAIALSLKQTMVGVWVALWIYLILRMAVKREWELWKQLGWAAAGALVVIAGWVVFFLAHGALESFWSVAYVFNFLYSDITTDRRVWAFGEMISFLAQSSPYFCFAMIAWCAGLVSIGRAAWRSGFAALIHHQFTRLPLVFALINLPIEFLLINTSGKNFRHYFISLLPGMAILTAWGLNELWRIRLSTVRGRGANQSRSPMMGKVARIAAAVLLVGILFWPAFRNAQMLFSAPRGEAIITTTVHYIRTKTKPDDYVLMWGSQTVVNFLSGRQSPTRFVHQKPLFRAGYAKAEYSNEMLRDLQDKRPVLIINTHLPSTPFVETIGDGKCQAPNLALPDGIDKVFAYICDHYRLVTTLTKDQWEVYQIIK